MALSGGYRPPLIQQPASSLARINERHWLASDLLFVHSGHQAFWRGQPIAPQGAESTAAYGLGGTQGSALEQARGWKPDGTNFVKYAVGENLALPLTLCAWWHGTSAASSSGILSVRRATDVGGVMLRRDPSELSGASATTIGNATSTASSTAAYVSGRWMHGVAVFAGAADRTAYGDGGTPVQNTASRAFPTDCSVIGIGVDTAGTGGVAAATAISAIALPMVISRVLDAEEVERLHNEQRSNPWGLFQERRIWVPITAAGGGTTVSVPAGGLTITGYAPTVSTPLSIAIPAGALTLTGFAPTVSTAVSIAVPAGSLTLTGFAPTVSTPLTISVPAGSLTLTGYAPTVTVAAAGTTISVPAGSLSLTGYAPTVSISAVIPIPAGALSLTGYAPTISTSVGTVVPMPAGSLTLTGFAPTVYNVGDFTTSVFYLPLRAYADGMSGTVDPTTALNNLRSLLPSQRTPLSNADGTMSSQWYRFYDYLVNQYLGGLTQPTVADIVASVEATQASVNASAGATALIAQQAQANAESLAAVVQVTQNAAIPGSAQIPPVSLSYLEP